MGDLIDDANFPVREGNGNAGLLEFAPDGQVNFGTQGARAIARVVDPEAEFEVDARFGELLENYLPALVHVFS